jgi:hypothetical protein
MDDQEPASPEVQARVTASFERQGLMRHLGARLTRIAPGCVHIVLPYRPEISQQHGYFHAGATSAIADSAGGYAAFTLFPEDTSVLTVDTRSTSSPPPSATTSKSSAPSSAPAEPSPSAASRSSPPTTHDKPSWPPASKP